MTAKYLISRTRPATAEHGLIVEYAGTFAGNVPHEWTTDRTAAYQITEEKAYQVLDYFPNGYTDYGLKETFELSGVPADHLEAKPLKSREERAAEFVAELTEKRRAILAEEVAAGLSFHRPENAARVRIRTEFFSGSFDYPTAAEALKHLVSQAEKAFGGRSGVDPFESSVIAADGTVILAAELGEPADLKTWYGAWNLNAAKVAELQAKVAGSEAPVFIVRGSSIDGTVWWNGRGFSGYIGEAATYITLEEARAQAEVASKAGQTRGESVDDVVGRLAVERTTRSALELRTEAVLRACEEADSDLYRDPLDVAHEALRQALKYLPAESLVVQTIEAALKAPF